AEHIGVEHLSSYLKSKGHQVDLIFDPGLGNNFFLNLPFLNKFISDELLVKRARKFNPDIIAFSCITNSYSVIKKVAKKLKKALNVPIIIGGIHPTSVPEDVIKEDCFDILCVGEGEEAFAELLEGMEKKQDIGAIKNLWVKDKNGEIHKNELRPLLKDLDKMPFADKSIFYQYGVINSRIMVMTGRGCPFQCTFCVNSFKKGLYPGQSYLRRRSVDNVIEELIALKNKYKPKAFRFEDDTFTYDLNWLKEFRPKYLKSINLPFHCYVTPSTAADGILEEIKLAGCQSVSMGVQSGDQQIRTKILKRHHTDEDIIAAAERIKKYKLKLISEFIFGFPTETPKEMWKSLELNGKLKAYNTASFIFYPFPKTELAEYCLKNGYLSEEKYELIKQGYGSYHLTCLLEHPYEDDVYKFNSILPVYNKAPKILKPFLRKILKMKYGIIHKFIYLFSIPLIDFDEFLIRIIDMPKMIIKTRKILNS
ncbi:MAG: Radical SAM domain protein, partial [Parcubacteria group bacterium GW2011_GWB1_41_6]